MNIRMDKNVKGNVKGRFGKYSFEVGILQDGPHKDALRGKRGEKGLDVRAAYAGGPRRKVGRTSSATLAQVSKSNRERLGFNYLAEPFKHKSSDILKFAREFFKLAFGKSEKKRAENLLQAVVRNPILRGEYGPQSALTTKIKGFDRPMIDTAQLFKAIRARCTVRAGLFGRK